MSIPAFAVVGLDLSLTSSGVAVVTDRAITTHRLVSKGSAGATLDERANRLRTASERALSFVPSLWRSGPVLVVVEAPAYDSRTGSQHDRSGLWWQVVGSLFARDVSVVEVTTGGRAKYATGKGNAGKDAVLAAVVRRYPQVEVDGNDVADALVLAAMGARALGQPIDSVPELNLAAMSVVRWPEWVVDAGTRATSERLTAAVSLAEAVTR